MVSTSSFKSSGKSNPLSRDGQRNVGTENILQKLATLEKMMIPKWALISGGTVWEIAALLFTLFHIFLASGLQCSTLALICVPSYRPVAALFEDISKPFCSGNVSHTPKCVPLRCFHFNGKCWERGFHF